MSEHPIVWRTKVAAALAECGLLSGRFLVDADSAARIVEAYDDPELEVIANACAAAVAWGATTQANTVRQQRREVVEQRVAITRAWRLFFHVRHAPPTEIERAIAAAVLVLGEAGVYGDNEDLDALLAEVTEADEWQHVSTGPHTAEASTVSFGGSSEVISRCIKDVKGGLQLVFTPNAPTMDGGHQDRITIALEIDKSKAVLDGVVRERTDDDRYIIAVTGGTLIVQPVAEEATP